MPTFCRHNRFLDRCPICSRAQTGEVAGAAGAPGRVRKGGAAATRGARSRTDGLRVRREGRAQDDGYRSALVPGLRASADAERLVDAIAFSSGRLALLGVQPPGVYAEARSLAAVDLERATWICLLCAYLSPLEDPADPYRGIRGLVDATPEGPGSVAAEALSDAPLGARSSHETARGPAALEAYAQWVLRAGGPDGGQATAFLGDPAWSPQRRFERLFERLALPGFSRTGRYELLVTLGRLGLYELRADSLHLAAAQAGVPDRTAAAAKRVFGIGDPLLLERRARALADRAGVPVEALDLALDSWAAEQPLTLGLPPEIVDEAARARAAQALAP